MESGQTNTNHTTRAPSRFDYVAYDDQAQIDQTCAKDQVAELETFINKRLISPRAKALALTKLEEVYMWIGKAVRDDQIQRNGSAPLQEQRNNS
jgi:hypothetical protein